MNIRKRYVLVAAAALLAAAVAPVALAADLTDVGSVNQTQIGSLPAFQRANQELAQYKAQLDQQFAAQTRGKSDADKARIAQTFQQRLGDRQRQVMGPLFGRAQAAIAQVSSNKNLSIVVDKSMIVYGGQDITKNVIDLLNSPGAIAPPVSSPPPSEIGYVDQTQLDQLPKIKSAKDDFMKAANDQRQQAQQKMAGAKNDRNAQQQIFQDYQKALTAQQDKILKPLTNQIKDATAKAAQQKKLILVIDRANVIYGGTDITSDVQNALK